MSRMREHIGNCVAFILLVVGGVCLIGGIISAVVAAIIAPPEEPVYRIIEVKSKTKEWAGQVCVGNGFVRTCDSTYRYFINGEKSDYRLWSRIEEGKIYKCDQYDGCEELKGEE